MHELSYRKREEREPEGVEKAEATHLRARLGKVNHNDKRRSAKVTEDTHYELMRPRTTRRYQAKARRSFGESSCAVPLSSIFTCSAPPMLPSSA